MKNNFFVKLRGIKGIWIIVGLAVIGILFIVIGSFLPNGSKAEGEEFSRSDYEKDIEERIAKIVSEIGGISDVSVMVTLDSTVSYMYAENGKGSSSEYVTVRDKDGNESGVLISENTPGVRGVAVVCSGGEDPQKRLEIIKLVSALMKLPENRVYVGGRN